jgi:hypothetical protein
MFVIVTERMHIINYDDDTQIIKLKNAERNIFEYFKSHLR